MTVAAATTIQRYARGRLGRRRRFVLEAMQRLVFLMQKQEVRAARIVQRQWRGKCSRARQEYTNALVKIQALAKGHQERERLKAERQWAAESAAAMKAAERERLVSECTGIIEKRGRRCSLGPWEVIVWQERFVTCIEDGLIYQVRSRSLRLCSRSSPLTHLLLTTFPPVLPDLCAARHGQR